MAASLLPAQTQEELQKVLTCSICSKAYDDDEHQAKCLPCLHSYCISCLHSHAGKQPTFNCPECDTIVGSLEGTIDSLPDNFIVENLKAYNEIFRQSVCGSCDDEVNQAESFCHDCSCFLCEDCVSQHKRMRLLKGHKLLTMAELQEKKSNPLRQQQLRCKTHTKQDLSMYCKGADCKVAICASGIVAHNGHDLIELTAAIDEVVERMRRSSSKVQARNHELTLSREAVENKRKTLTEMYEHKEKDMQNSVEKIHSLIDARHDNARSHLKNLYEIEMKHLTGSIDSIEFLARQLTGACEFAAETCDITSPTQLLASQNQIMVRLQELENIELPKSTSDKTDLHFTDKHHSVTVLIQDSLQHLCDVDWLSQPPQTYKPVKTKQPEAKSSAPAPGGGRPTSAQHYNGNQKFNPQSKKVTLADKLNNIQANPQNNAVNPSRCTIQLRQPGDRGGQYNATVQTVGFYGQPITTGGVKVEATQDGSPLQVYDNMNGTYTFRYSLLLGKTIKVKINGTSMYGSPFSG